MEQLCRLEHVGFVLGASGAQQHGAARYAEAYGEQCFQDCFGGVVAYTSYFAGGCHVDSEYRVGALEA